MTYKALQSSLNALHLDIFGGFHPAQTGAKTLLLLGPLEPGFWPNFSASPEYLDENPDPLDRWSARVITPWAAKQNATAVFPSDGPPYAPFIDWAYRTGRAWASPVGMLVHDRAGLFVSYRAAITLPKYIELPKTGAAPCTTCTSQPCLTACPVNALSPQGYDVPACKTHLNTALGQPCMTAGCLARNACPAGHGYGRLPEQSAFHMAAFNPK